MQGARLELRQYSVLCKCVQEPYEIDPQFSEVIRRRGVAAADCISARLTVGQLRNMSQGSYPSQ
jgi:hypothetical protein